MRREADIFVSYARTDHTFVRVLVEALRKSGRSCWIDVDDIPPAEQWREEVRKAIKTAAVFIYIVTPDATRSMICTQELRLAMALGKHIVPVLRREVPAGTQPAAIDAINWVSFREADKFESSFARLIEAVDLVPLSRVERFMEAMPLFLSWGIKYTERVRTGHAWLSALWAVALWLYLALDGLLKYYAPFNNPLRNDDVKTVALLLTVVSYTALIGMKSRKKGRLARLALASAALGAVAAVTLIFWL